LSPFHFKRRAPQVFQSASGRLVPLVRPPQLKKDLPLPFFCAAPPRLWAEARHPVSPQMIKPTPLRKCTSCPGPFPQPSRSRAKTRSSQRSITSLCGPLPVSTIFFFPLWPLLPARLNWPQAFPKRFSLGHLSANGQTLPPCHPFSLKRVREGFAISPLSRCWKSPPPQLHLPLLSITSPGLPSSLVSACPFAPLYSTGL